MAGYSIRPAISSGPVPSRIGAELSTNQRTLISDSGTGSAVEPGKTPAGGNARGMLVAGMPVGVVPGVVVLPPAGVVYVEGLVEQLQEQQQTGLQQRHELQHPHPHPHPPMLACPPL